MPTLARDLRRELEKTVKQARSVAESGVRKVLEQLGVHHHEPYGSMTLEQRALRNRLRTHGRQLGDQRDRQKGTQTISRLIQEFAYQHWHRMLFARFLAEADLLIEPRSGVAVTLDDCQELAREEGTEWLTLASDYAGRMLPQIFRLDDPVLDVTLPPETRADLEELLKLLPRDVFTADDSLGWVYQFWQTEKRNKVNLSEAKIGADELPSVTQLFTEDYMVHYLLHNTFGAWWAGKVLSKDPVLACSAQSEDDLRSACRVDDIEWTYLRFVRSMDEGGIEGPWHPAAGTYEGWPVEAKNITVLDPCMGSGHFLVLALPILVAFRMAEEGLKVKDATDAVLADNLFGLEIDPRCTQIAAFNLAFSAWRRTGFHVLPALNLACSGLAIGVTKSEWLKLAKKAVVASDPAAKPDFCGVKKDLPRTGLEERVKNGLEALYDLFAKAPWLGSLINPHRKGADIFQVGFDTLEPLLTSILEAPDSDETRELAVAAQGMAKAAEILRGRFVLVSTNVPFLGRGRQDEILKTHCGCEYPASKNDLATCFIERCLDYCCHSGSVSLVTPQNWLFLGAYRKLRKKLLINEKWSSVARLGSRAFETISGEVVSVALVSIEKRAPGNAETFFGIDVSESREAMKKAERLQCNQILHPLLQATQRDNPDTKILLRATVGGQPLDSYATIAEGLHTGDYPRFGRKFWEVEGIGDQWSLQQATVDKPGFESGCESILLWEGGNGRMIEQVRKRLDTKNVSAWIKGDEVWGRLGITIGAMGTLKHGRYFGMLFTHGAYVIVPNDPSDLAAIWCFVDSGEFLKEARELDQKVSIARQAIVNVPYNAERWREEAARRFPHNLPEPETHDPTQWLFSGGISDATKSLQVAVARFLGYRWPRQLGIDIPGASSVKSEGQVAPADDDGIVCLTAVKGEAPAHERLTSSLADAFGADWSAEMLSNLLADVGFYGKSLDDWLRDGFFDQHCTLFQQRPFIWQIWDGRRDGFHALVNYHRLAAPNGEGRRTLEKLIYSYLGVWIDRQHADQKFGVEGADARIAHAKHLRVELIKILEGEPPYDIFVRWKPLHQQPIGWDPDVDDGVRINIRPFMTSRPLGARSASACILRTTPKIRWKKDRGKEPRLDKEDYPWFWDWDGASVDFVGRAEYDGNRWNDMHYSISFKQFARELQFSKDEGNS